MRDANGVYVGENRCQFWRGVDRLEAKTCCGGRQKTVAYAKCDVKGAVLAEPDCTRTVCRQRHEPDGSR